MIALYTAIYKVFTDDSGQGGFYDALGGRLYPMAPPVGTTYPLGVLTMVSSVPDKTFDHHLERTVFRLTIQSKGAYEDEIIDLTEKMLALYDDAALTFAGGEYTHVSVDRVNVVRVDTGERGLHQVVATYRVIARKT